jgi:Kef-type K+ transport system membrane component KefB
VSSLAAAASTLLAVVLVAGAARALGAVASRLGQPSVVGEILAGVVLGPSILGALVPGLHGWLASERATAVFGHVGKVGVVVFMFLVAAEVDLTPLLRRARLPVLVAIGSFVVPFALGVSLAPVVRDVAAPGVDDGAAFPLFLGTALAVTALPVLARILQFKGLTASRVGLVGLTAAAVEDVAAWTVLALAGAMATGDAFGVADPPPAALGALAAMALVLVTATIRRHGVAGPRTVTLVAGLLASGAAVALLGVHPAIAAFFLGALVPRGSLRKSVARALDIPMRWVLLPVFFAAVGLQIQFAGFDGAQALGVALLILAVAVLGKFLGATAGARLAGLPGRDAMTIGILMNTRGVTELVVILVGREAGLVPDPLFSMLVVMALITTLMTAPLLDLMARGRWSLAPAGAPGRVRAGRERREPPVARGGTASRP